MQKKLFLLIIGILFIGMHSVFAAAKTAAADAPTVKTSHINASCTPTKVLKSQNKNIILEGATDTHVYLIKNHTQKSIWLDHPGKHSGASAGWSSYLKPGDWSALLVEKHDFSVSCSVIAPGKMETLDCAQSLSVCKPMHLAYTSHRKGTFWLVEGKPWKELLKGLQARGVR